MKKKKSFELPLGTMVEVVKIENGKFVKKREMTYTQALSYKSKNKVKYIIFQIGFSQFK